MHAAGELDVATTPQLERTLSDSQSQGRLVVVDLRELAFMDSSAVQALVEASTRARRVGRRVVLVRGAPGIGRMLALTGTFEGVQIAVLDPAEPPVQVLLQLAEADVG